MSSHDTPTITEMQVIPVAGRDSMLLNIGGAHSPYFTRNLVILKDSHGNVGVGEAPGGETIQTSLEQSRERVIGQSIGKMRSMMLRCTMPAGVPILKTSVKAPGPSSCVSMRLPRLRLRYLI